MPEVSVEYASDGDIYLEAGYGFDIQNTGLRLNFLSLIRIVVEQETVKRREPIQNLENTSI